MDDYMIGSSSSDAFDVDGKLRYSSDAGVLVHSSNASSPYRLTEHLDPEADHVVAVQYAEETHQLGARKATIAGLLQDWKLPRVAMSQLFTNEEHRGFYYLSMDSLHCCWYHLPVQKFDGGFKKSSIHVWQMLEVNPSRVRILVLYSPSMAAEVKNILPSLFSVEHGHQRLSWCQVHLTLIQTTIATWRAARWASMSLGFASLQGLVVALDQALEDGAIRTCDQTISQLNFNINYMLELQTLISDFFRYCERKLPNSDEGIVHTALSCTQIFQNDITFLLSSYTFLKQQLLLSRHTLSISIKIKNASYMRTNTIALRRIGEQTQEEARRAKEEAELTKKNSRSVMKIAYVTMFFLPATFVATLFSMPFLDLDENQRFSSAGKIWIYAVVTVVLTALTFLGSTLWDRLIPVENHHSSSIASEESDSKNDQSVLEPKPHYEPSAVELIRQMISRLEHDGEIEGRDEDDELRASGDEA